MDEPTVIGGPVVGASPHAEASAPLPRDLDLWAPVPLDGLPGTLLAALEAQDWPALRIELGAIMDSLSTDGVFGRALIQFVRRIPLGIDPVFDRYRASVAIDHGDWDDLAACLRSRPAARDELLGIRDMMLSPSGHQASAATRHARTRVLFDGYEFKLERSAGKYLRWTRRFAQRDGAQRYTREDIATGRHARYRALYHAGHAGIAEALAGRLSVAAAFAHEGERLGDAGEPLRDICADLGALVDRAMGDAKVVRLNTIARLPQPDGLSPLGAYEGLAPMLPLLEFAGLDHLVWVADLLERIAIRFGSPRMLLWAQTWVVAGATMSRASAKSSELPAVLAQSRAAPPGLRVVPELLEAISTRRPAAFAYAEHLALRSRHVWAQVSALTWLAAQEPAPQTSRRLARLLRATGWRRPALCPPDVAAEATLGLIATGARGAEVVELAVATGQPSAIIAVARAHLEDATPSNAQHAALEGLASLRTTHARELLRKHASRPDNIGSHARTLLSTHDPAALSEREIEVLRLAGKGLTNRKIGERLNLSEHTIARHLANARAKLGATNRAAAATMLPRDSTASSPVPGSGPRR